MARLLFLTIAALTVAKSQQQHIRGVRRELIALFDPKTIESKFAETNKLHKLLNRPLLETKVVVEEKKRPLQIFPLLKELNAGWGNMQPPQLLNKNAHGKGALIIDVGLDAGDEFFLALNNGFEVVGFEPNPASFARLAEKCNRIDECHVVDLDETPLPLQRKEGHSYLINAGAGKESGVLTLKKNGPASSLTSDNNKKGKKRNKNKNAEVKVVRIDSIIQDDVYLFKVDTQGFDQFVMEGSSALFQNHVVRQVIVEVDPFLMQKNQHTPASLLELLQSYGLICFQARSDQRKECGYYGERIDKFQEIFDGEEDDKTYNGQKLWSKCWEDLLCVNVEKVYPGEEVPPMMMMIQPNDQV
mmetsp:Transcript_5099/g.7813  ORF Transcript_5099/g.7813 Transcript_5099/m.7813 type:complete len:358 (+) Transcript_5099:117-1190(+)